jgi:hypothetical protein
VAPEEKQQQPEKINLDDGHTIKHKLDSTASEVGNSNGCKRSSQHY